MKNTRALALASATLLASTMLSSAAYAQTFADPDSRRALVGPGNIDPRTGSFTYDATDLSVGVGEFPSRLELKRWQRTTMAYGVTNPMGGFDHNFNISIGCAGGGTNYPGTCLGGANRVVRIGPVAHSFRYTASGWISEYGDGEQLVEESGRFIFRSRSGDQITFPKSSSFYNYHGTTHLASVWEKANGESIVFTYEVALKASAGWNPERRLFSVVNSRGFGFRFNYLLSGNATPDGSTNPTFTDWKRKTIASVQAIAPGCTPDASMTCDTIALGLVSYTYSQWPTSNWASAMRMDRMTTPDGKQANFTWSADKLIESESNPAVLGATYFRNTYVNRAVTQQSDGKGKSWLFRRSTDTNGILTAEVEDPLNKVTKYSYASGVVAPQWVEDPLGQRTKYIYDSTIRVATVENPAGTKVGYTRDDRSNVTKVTTTPAAGGHANQPEMVFEYKFPAACDLTNWRICNRPSEVIDERLKSTLFEYDPAHGGVTASLSPGDTPEKRTLSKVGYSNFYRAPTVETSSSAAPLRDMVLPVSSETCLSSNGTTSYSCPASDQIKSSITYTASSAVSRSQSLQTSVIADPGGIAAETKLFYDAVGNISKIDGPKPGNDIYALSYSKSRKVTRRLSPDPDDAGPLLAAETNLQYDDAGNVSSVRAKLNGAEVVTSYGYDGNGALISKLDPASGTTSYTRDDAGRITEVSIVVDGVTRRQKTLFDDAGRPIEVRKAVGSAEEMLDTTVAYNGSDAPESLKDGNGNITTFCYDGYGRLIETRYPGTGSPGIAFSCSSVPIGSMSPSADFRSLVLDAGGNPVSIRLRDGKVVTQSFDAQGRVETRNAPDADQDIGYTYDLAGRLTRADVAGDAEKTVLTAYDKVGRVLSSTSMGKTVSYRYGADQSSVDIVFPDNKFITYNYDLLGRTSEIWGIEETVFGGWRTPQLAAFSYDQLSRRTKIDRGNTTSSSYTYDGNQRLAELSFDLNGIADDLRRTLTYNSAGEIKSASVDNDLYAAPAEPTGSKSYVPNGLNQYQSIDGLAPSYDRRGNLAALGIKTYAYDSDNRMVSAVDGANSVTLEYDALGRLASVASSVGATNMLYAGNMLIGEFDDLGNLTKRYVQGAGSNEPLVVYEGAAKKWLYGDERGSIVAAADATGARTGVANYGLYGESSGTPISRFGYTGQAYLPEIGLYQFRARSYDPYLGRFMQADPLGYADGDNLYAYVGGDPVNLVDPDGTTGSPYDLPPVVIGVPAPSPSAVWGPSPHWSYYTNWPTDFGGNAALWTLFNHAQRWHNWLGGQGRAAGELARQGICHLPALGGGGSAGGYGGLGGGVNGGFTFDPKNGQVSLGAGLEVGGGAGAYGKLVSAGQFQVSTGGVAGWNGSVGASANVQLGPISAGASRELIGTGAKKGSPSTNYNLGLGGEGLTANVNLTGNIGYTFKPKYDLGCK